LVTQAEIVSVERFRRSPDYSDGLPGKVHRYALLLARRLVFKVACCAAVVGRECRFKVPWSRNYILDCLSRRKQRNHYFACFDDKIVSACGRRNTVAIAPIRSNGPVLVTVNFRPGPPRHKEGEGCVKHPHFAMLNS